jgi:uncharacterized RDD family membrane protein YckC
MSRAGFGIRVGAYAIDTFIIVVISSVLFLLASVMLELGMTDMTAFLLRMAPCLVGPVYFWLTEYGSLTDDRELGSVGKRLCGLRVGVEEDDKPPRLSLTDDQSQRIWWRLTLKTAPQLVSALAYGFQSPAIFMIGMLLGLAFIAECLPAFGEKRQTLHDVLTRTVVLNIKKSGQAVGAPSQRGSSPALEPVRVEAHANGTGFSDRLIELARLRDAGIVTGTEFQAKKEEILSRV